MLKDDVRGPGRPCRYRFLWHLHAPLRGKASPGWFLHVSLGSCALDPLVCSPRPRVLDVLCGAETLDFPGIRCQCDLWMLFWMVSDRCAAPGALASLFIQIIWGPPGLAFLAFFSGVPLSLVWVVSGGGCSPELSTRLFTLTDKDPRVPALVWPRGPCDGNRWSLMPWLALFLFGHIPLVLVVSGDCFPPGLLVHLFTCTGLVLRAPASTWSWV